MRCADSNEVNRGLDAGTTLNRSSLGVLLLMRGGLDIADVWMKTLH